MFRISILIATVLFAACDPGYTMGPISFVSDKGMEIHEFKSTFPTSSVKNVETFTTSALVKIMKLDPKLVDSCFKGMKVSVESTEDIVPEPCVEDQGHGCVSYHRGGVYPDIALPASTPICGIELWHHTMHAMLACCVEKGEGICANTEKDIVASNEDQKHRYAELWNYLRQEYARGHCDGIGSAW